MLGLRRRVLLVLLMTTPLQAQGEIQTKSSGSLVIAGGGALPREGIAQFCELAGGEKATLVVIPTASRRVGPDRLKKLWKQRGFTRIEVLHTTDRQVADSAKFVEPLRSANAVWFGGGAQSRLAKYYLDTRAEREIVAVYQRGGVVGGTSAGAAIQSRVMIQSGNPVPVIGKGLDLLPDCIIDQHFLARDRFNRLLYTVTKHPKRVGVGISEGTMLIYRGGQCQVIGKAFVTTVAVQPLSKPPTIHTFGNGSKFRIDAVRGR